MAHIDTVFAQSMAILVAGIVPRYQRSQNVNLKAHLSSCKQ